MCGREAARTAHPSWASNDVIHILEHISAGLVLHAQDIISIEPLEHFVPKESLDPIHALLNRQHRLQLLSLVHFKAVPYPFLAEARPINVMFSVRIIGHVELRVFLARAALGISCLRLLRLLPCDELPDRCCAGIDFLP